jgi:hypothetical protein
MKSLYTFSFILLGIGLTVLVLYFFKFHCGFSGNQDTWGQFGDLMGGVLNPLISLVAILAVYKTIRLTQLQISSGRFFELIRLHNDHRKEFSYSDESVSCTGSAAFEKYLEIIKKIHRDFCLQYFKNRVSQYENGLIEQEYQLVFNRYNKNSLFHFSEVTAISIMSTWKIDDRMNKADEIIVNISERQCLEIISLEYSLVKQAKNDLVHWSTVYNEFYKHHGNEVGRYFRNLYNILESIEKMRNDETESLSKLFRAQMSRSEIALFYFNLLSEYSSDKFYRMVKKYHLLKGLYEEDVCNFGNYQVIDLGEHLELLKRKYDG